MFPVAVTETYAQLAAEGYLEARPGSWTRVRCPGQRSVAASASDDIVGRTARFDMAPGLPDLRAFSRTLGEGGRRPGRVHDAPRAQVFAPGGHPHLGALLADYLNRARGRMSLQTSSSAPASRKPSGESGSNCCPGGIQKLGFEQPGWVGLHAVARAAGITPLPVPVESQGLRVDVLNRHSSLRAVIVTPAHQCPCGSVLARSDAPLFWTGCAIGTASSSRAITTLSSVMNGTPWRPRRAWMNHACSYSSLRAECCLRPWRSGGSLHRRTGSRRLAAMGPRRAHHPR